jgi:hypothetical protein
MPAVLSTSTQVSELSSCHQATVITLVLSIIDWFGLRCLTPLSTLFQLYRGCQFYGCKTFYYIFLKKYTERPINSQNKWENLLNIKEVNWEFVYILSNNTLKMFQYNLLHRTIPTNTFLYKCRLVETELHAFCGETKETILHLVCDCNIVYNIWLKIYEQLQIRCL